MAVGFAGCLGDGEVDDSPTDEDGATPGPEGDTEVTAGTAPGIPPFEIKEGGDLIGFTINSAAYQSEYLRSALQSVDAGQLTAARSIGLSRLGGIRYVVLPQALRYAIPGWSNELDYLIKYSSPAAFITVPELFFRARAIASQTFRFTVLFTLVALFYLAIVLSASSVMATVERETAIPGLGQVTGRSQ